jgi:hypothetical protein
MTIASVRRKLLFGLIIWIAAAAGGVAQIEGAAGAGTRAVGVDRRLRHAGRNLRHRFRHLYRYRQLSVCAVWAAPSDFTTGSRRRSRASGSAWARPCPGKSLTQDVLGFKVNVAGDAVCDQDT